MSIFLHPKASFLTLLFLSFSTFIAHAIVPQNETFKFVNSGELGPFIVEYGADYRMISIFNAPFQVGFYNTTPNAYTLALRVGLQRSEQLFRLLSNGNMVLIDAKDVRDGVWKVTYTLFDRDFDESECQLPERCGKFGLCEDNQCVGCPLENGIFGWSNKCSPKPLGVCKESEFHYYKIEGVEHYMSKYTIGDRVSEANCGNKCTKDCKCVGYFYHKDNSRCWIAYDLQTLTKVANTTHVGYIKVPNK
ncbi:hypothetical protein P8452_52106 [Trifolium repens]|nr:hypothetical protein P8452_52106 [Trifolium repens]